MKEYVGSINLNVKWVNLMLVRSQHLWIFEKDYVGGINMQKSGLNVGVYIVFRAWVYIY